jgi:enoyl-CoA hydratase/carnithine racemase
MSVHLEKHDAVALVTIDRVERRNAIDDRTADLLLATFERIEADADVHVSVLRGAGQHWTWAWSDWDGWSASVLRWTWLSLAGE